jgi:hypothetical protein
MYMCISNTGKVPTYVGLGNLDNCKTLGYNRDTNKGQLKAMASLNNYASYQDNNIPYLETTTLNVTLAGIDFTAYIYQGETYLSLSQVSNAVGKGAISLSGFCGRYSQEALMGCNDSPYYAYTMDSLNTDGVTDPCIVHLNVAQLFWVDQAVRMKNVEASKIMVNCSREAFILKVHDTQNPTSYVDIDIKLLKLKRAYKDAVSFYQSLNFLLYT